MVALLLLEVESVVVAEIASDAEDVKSLVTENEGVVELVELEDCVNERVRDAVVVCETVTENDEEPVLERDESLVSEVETLLDIVPLGDTDDVRDGLRRVRDIETSAESLAVPNELSENVKDGVEDNVGVAESVGDALELRSSVLDCEGLAENDGVVELVRLLLYVVVPDTA